MEKTMEPVMFFKYLIIMAGVTYLIRVIPFVLIRKKIQNKYIRSFLNYIPYTVLTAMTIPAIFYSTSVITAAVAGFVVAVLLSYKEKSLITVALIASVTVMAVQYIIDLM